MKVPQSVSFVQPLISRGEEVKNVDPVVTYFCFYSAVRQVLETKLHTKDPEVAEFATQLLNEIELMKDGIQDREMIEDDDVSRAHVSNFATLVFNKADKATKTQKVNKATGAGFAAAAVFLGLESVWGETEPDTLEKIKYAKFQATRILKAIKLGQDPNDLYVNTEESANEETSEAPKEENTEHEPIDESNADGPQPEGTPEEEETSTSIALPKAPQADPESDIILPQPPRENPGDELPLPHPVTKKPEGNVSPSPPPILPPKRAPEERTEDATPRKPPVVKNTEPSITAAPRKMTPEAIRTLTSVTSSAQKHAKYAMSALNYDDIRTAVKELEQALQLLRTYEESQ